MEQQTTTPEQNETPAAPVVTFELIKARFNKELTKFKYQEALDRFTALKITTENTASIQETMKKVRGFINTIGDIKEAGKKPAWEECKMWDRAYNDILTPLKQILVDKTNELQKVLDKIAEENRLKKAEEDRVNGINKDMDTFFLNTMQEIASAKSVEEIVAIEKRIGSHKANKAKYQEFLPEFIKRCGDFIPKIKLQKQAIKDLEEIKKQTKEAEAAGDDRKVLELREAGEAVKDTIDHTKITIQEEAIRQATAPDQTTTLQPAQQSIKYRRQSWKWKVDDIKLLAKKAPHLTVTLPNEEKIDDLLRTMKADGSLKDVEKLEYMGIIFYLEKLA